MSGASSRHQMLKKPVKRKIVKNFRKNRKMADAES
ncbi:MAG: hypothetical protein RL015_2014 [Verrucomicrobiota bacterium]